MRDKKEQSGEHKYKSPFTGEFIQAHQYIGDLMTDREAKKSGEVLTYKYWLKEGKWEKVLVKNILLAGKIIKKYSERAIINVINKESWCHSIIYLTPKIKEEQDKLDKQIIKTPEIQTQETTEYSKPRRKGMFKNG